MTFRMKLRSLTCPVACQRARPYALGVHASWLAVLLEREGAGARLVVETLQLELVSVLVHTCIRSSLEWNRRAFPLFILCPEPVLVK